MVSGTTRRPAPASIITARGAPVSLARYSVCPANAKPCSSSFALSIGAVTTAPARRAMAAPTAVLMAATTGLPCRSVSMERNASSGTSAWRRNICRSPTSRSARPLQLPCSDIHAFATTSGPMPEGSPMVIKMGVWECPSAGLDIGFAAQIAHITPGKHSHLLLVQLLFDLIARGDDEHALFWGRVAAAHDQFHAGRRRERGPRITGLGLCYRGLHVGAQIGQFHRAQVHVHGARNPDYHVARMRTV